MSPRFNQLLAEVSARSTPVVEPYTSAAVCLATTPSASVRFCCLIGEPPYARRHLQRGHNCIHTTDCQSRAGLALRGGRAPIEPVEACPADAIVVRTRADSQCGRRSRARPTRSIGYGGFELASRTTLATKAPVCTVPNRFAPQPAVVSSTGTQHQG
eukprot:2696147-Prymnesium_polylepis.1